MQAMEQAMAAAFLERKLKEERAWRLHQARWNFTQHRRRNPAHQAWKRRRASGRA